ncbi:MBL fold metallo-hydrolase [Roseibium polysiphoniae]|uniref:MBL fold metallo-hydrolase n=1 Tax=Roseibium polysiphoniae TaxID=2571221 RepID=A0A944GU65_9HYPH|nr:MBL fold metallo-hydrolase [Roseibium polysiphoniae]
MKHDRQFDPAYGSAIEISDGIRRLTAPNPSPFTFHGTNTYLVGQDSITVIDPGPDSPEHIDTILKVSGGASVETILVSHTHLDHSPGARLLQAKTGAPIVGCAAYRPARDLGAGESNPMDASSDRDYKPDLQLEDGSLHKTSGADFEVIETPGHTDNHLCFALKGSPFLFSADHVMAWSTSIVAPPDGSMRSYMASLDRLLARQETIYLPGHGGLVRDAHDYVADLKAHRLQREASILDQLSTEPISIPNLVLRIYHGLDPALRPAAALSVFAHLEDLASRKLVIADPEVRLESNYRRA